jgi:type II secretion system protein C
VRKNIKNSFFVIVLAASGVFGASVFLQNINLRSQDLVYQQAKKLFLQSFSPAKPFAVPSKDPLTMPLFNSRLKLLGTIIGDRSLAIISDPDSQKRGLYHLNDTVDSARIVCIAAGKILLQYDGALRELLIDRSSGLNKPVVVFAGSLLDDITVSKSFLRAEVEKSNEVFAKVKIMPVTGDGLTSAKGIRVDNIPCGSFIEQVGMKSGDLICSVQGQPVVSSFDAIRALQHVRQQSDIKVDLVRNGKLLSLNYRLRE